MNIHDRLIRQAKSKAVGAAKEKISDGTKNTFATVSELVNDAKDVSMIAGNAVAGNWVGAAAAALKNRKIRRIIILALIVAMIISMIWFMIMMTLIIGSSDMFLHPLVNFGPHQTITETGPNRKHVTIHFLQLAREWEHSMNLTPNEILQVNQLQLGLSYGLLETFYEMGARQGAKNPLKTLNYIVKQLQPSAIHFQSVKLKQVTTKDVKDSTTGKVIQKRIVSYVTKEVLKDIVRYNGYWTVQWHIASEPNGSQIVVLDGATLTRKDYSPLYKAEAAFDFQNDIADQQELFGQALVLDSNFYDPSALPILQMLEGGVLGGDGPPEKGIPLPQPQIITILQQAIQIDHVPGNWLSGLEIIVGHEDSSGNPYAVDPILVDGEHASGLMQMLPSTFWSDHVSGYDNIWNPLDNAVAAIRHIEGAWGSPYHIPGVISGAYHGY